MSVRVLGSVLFLVAALVACGEPQTAGPDPADATSPGSPTPTELIVAPDCEVLREEAGANASMPESPPPPSFDREELRRWASAQPDFAGMWMHPPGSNRFTVAFADEVEMYRAEAHERFGEEVRVIAAEHTLAELEALHEEIGRDTGDLAQRQGDNAYLPAPGTILGQGLQPQFGRVSVDVVAGDQAALAAMSARYGADRLCLRVHELPEPMDPEGPVRPLAKASGWRDALGLGDDGPGDDGLLVDGDALVEIAYDPATAELAWDDNVPPGLPEREGVPVENGFYPAEDGVYGSLDDVDFNHQAVIVWSAGESGSCPGWLADIAVIEGHVTVEQGSAGVGGCTGDYNPYRMILAVDRDRLPDREHLPLPAPDDEPNAVPARGYE